MRHQRDMAYKAPAVPTVEPGKAGAVESFRHAAIVGLTATPKRISSRYFYDAEGDRLFQGIMACKDYYLTRAENGILQEQAAAVLTALAHGRQAFDLYELGAGDGTKTWHLLKQAMETGRAVVYRPIDISPHVLREAAEKLARKLPGLEVRPVQGEYFRSLAADGAVGNGPMAMLFLGSNIGNLGHGQAVALLKAIAGRMGSSGRLLIGFDLKKDPEMIRRAYNDDEGWTRAFNLNLLHRMNRELGTDFRLGRFVHAPVYDPATGQARSYLVSTCDQVVHLPGVGPIQFDAWEALHTEISQKYDHAMITELARASGLRIITQFFDRSRLFTDVVFGAA